MPTPAHRRCLAMLAAAAALSLGACGGSGGASNGVVDVPLDFPASALLSTPTDAGKLAVELRSSPQPPVRGSDAVEMRFTDTTGAPVTGLTITVLPWMPAHGHGTSVKPTVTEMEPGVYVAVPLYLYMAGAWELVTTVAGAVDDSVTPTLDIP